MRTSARAAISIVAKLVDVHATLCGSTVSFDVIGNCGGG